MASNRKLPRVKHADRPRDGETVLKQSGADLQNGWLARHGTLFATDDRLVFVPTVLDHALMAKRREIPLRDVTEIERFPISPDSMPPGGKRPRMLIHTEACVYEFMVGDLDAWIDALERVYARRARETGDDYAPRVTREGYVNLLMED
ncbi:MAG: hypothetical protein AB7O78_07165 [Thermoleophilia bacterium]